MAPFDEVPDIEPEDDALSLEAKSCEITALLAAADKGEAGAWDRIYTILYEEMRRLARSQLRRQSQQTVSPTTLVNETWIKLSKANINAENRRQLIGLAVHAMRSILIDNAKRKLAVKRGREVQVLSLSEGWDAAADGHLEQLLALDQALEKLSRAMPRLAQVVEWRYFGGMSEEEIAQALNINVRTVRRDWHTARQFLLGELDEG